MEAEAEEEQTEKEKVLSEVKVVLCLYLLTVTIFQNNYVSALSRLDPKRSRTAVTLLIDLVWHSLSISSGVCSQAAIVPSPLRWYLDVGRRWRSVTYSE